MILMIMEETLETNLMARSSIPGGSAGRACAEVSTPIANGSLPDRGKTGVIQRFISDV
jgi:hypothetical protein